MRTRRYLAAIAPAATALALTLVPAAQAQQPDHPTAGAACRGASCTSRDPHTTSCDQGAQSIATKSPAGGGPAVTLRNSRRCSAAWALVGTANENWRIRLDFKQGRTSRSYVVHASLSHPVHTPMTWSSNRYRACVEDYGGGWSCTRWY